MTQHTELEKQHFDLGLEGAQKAEAQALVRTMNSVLAGRSEWSIGLRAYQQLIRLAGEPVDDAASVTLDIWGHGLAGVYQQHLAREVHLAAENSNRTTPTSPGRPDKRARTVKPAQAKAQP